MSEARSFDETTIRPSVRSLRAYGTQRSRRSSLAGSSQVLTYVRKPQSTNKPIYGELRGKARV